MASSLVDERPSLLPPVEERELLESLSKKRRAFRESFKLKKDTESSERDEVTTGFVSDNLLDTMRARRVRRRLRKGELPPLELSVVSGRGGEGGRGGGEGSVEGTTAPFSSTSFTGEGPVDTSSGSIGKLREKGGERLTRFDELVLSPSHQRGQSPPPLSPPPTTTGLTKDRWKLLSSQMTQVKDKMNEEESMEFFLSSSFTSPPSREIEEETDGRGRTDEEERSRQDDDGEDRSNLINDTAIDQLGEEEANRRVIIQEYGLPEYITYQEHLKREEVMLYLPSRSMAPLESKTPDHSQPIFDEDIGLYVGKRPNVSIGNLAVMENRLLKRPDEGKGWFGKDGLLITTREPVHKLLTRPLIIGEEPQRHFINKEMQLSDVNPYTIKKIEDCSKEYYLEVYLNEVTFSHHPLYSTEHVLCSLLKDSVSKYHSIDRGRLEEQYRHQLLALQYCIYELRQSQSNHEQLQRYCLEVRMKRQELKQVSSEEYKLVQNILQVWKEIKRLREQQKYCCTNIRLILHKVPCDFESEQKQLEEDIDNEIEEKKEDYERSIAVELAHYKEEYAEWKAHEKQRRKSVRERSTAITTSEEGGGGEEERAVLSKRPRPVAPPSFNEMDARQELQDYYTLHHRKPGDPKLVPQLSYNHPITTSYNIPKEEQRRRTAVQSTKYKAKLSYNDKLVSTTTDRPLTSDFTVSFNELLTVSIIEVPHSIKVQLIEVSSKKCIVTLYIAIPDSNLVSSTAHNECYQFSCHGDVNYDHAAVGTGHTVPILNESSILVTSGELSLRVCWSEGSEGQPLCPPNIIHREESQLERIGHIGVTSNNNIHKLKKWIEEACLDPNDPRNSELLELVQSIPSSQEDVKYFRMDTLPDEARFVEDHEIENNKRFTLLKLRQQGHPALKGQSIPMNEDEITDSLWKSVMDYKPYSLAELPVSIFGNFFDSRREERLQYLSDIRDRILNRTGSHTTNELTLEDVIHQELIPGFNTVDVTDMSLFGVRRPLRPTRAIRNKPKLQNVHVEQCHVIVRVIRGINVLLREPDKGNVHSFVEVMFGKSFCKTSSTPGPHPHWNEELILSFHPPNNDFTPLALQKVTDELVIHLYDQVTIDLSLDDPLQRHHMLERRWLGSLTIPFSTLHAQNRIEGVFQVDTPPVTLGYQAPPTTDGRTYLQLFISLEPSLSLLPPINDRFDSLEDSLLLEKGRAWLTSLREQYCNRNYSMTALDVNGKNVFLTRFIRPQNPPTHIVSANELSQLNGLSLLKTMERLAWFVSLIPFLPDALLFSGTCDVWATSDVFLRMLGGDEEEHALLLCNYFLFLGIKAWLVLGTAIPEGPTAYVLTPHPITGTTSDSIYIYWNPSSGRHYSQSLAHIPLTSVGCVINNNNVWGNLQEWDHPSRLSLELNNNKKWCPLFTSNVDPLDSIQVEVLEYVETDSVQVQQLQASWKCFTCIPTNRIDLLVHDHIEELRVPQLTRWNRLCCRVLHTLLQKLEDNPLRSNELLQEHKTQLQEHLPGYKITGYPLHIRYNDTNQLLRAVESTGLHLCSYQRVEYGLSVYVHPYCNDILSVWLYIVLIIPP